MVEDKGDFSEHRAEWIHNINEGLPPPWPPPSVAVNTYLAKPGFIVKTLQDFYSFVDGKYGATWGYWSYELLDHGLWVWRTLQKTSQTLYLDAIRSGDS